MDEGTGFGQAYRSLHRRGDPGWPLDAREIPRTRLYESDHFISMDYSTTPRVDAHVDLPTGLQPALVDVPVDEPFSGVDGPCSFVTGDGTGVPVVGEVAGENVAMLSIQVYAHDALVYLVEATFSAVAVLPSGCFFTVDIGTAVMVAREEDLAAVQTGGDLRGVVDLPHGHVAKDQHSIRWRNDLVPTLYHRLVHLVHAAKGSPAILDDVGMT